MILLEKAIWFIYIVGVVVTVMPNTEIAELQNSPL